MTNIRKLLYVVLGAIAVLCVSVIMIRHNKPTMATDKVKQISDTSGEIGHSQPTVFKDVNTTTSLENDSSKLKFLEELDLDSIKDIHGLMGNTWDSFQVDIELESSNRDEIKEFVKELPTGGFTVTSMQLEQLHNIATELIYSYAKNDYAIWLNCLKASEEYISEERIKLARQFLKEEGNITENEIQQDAWELLLQTANVFKKNSGWRGLVSHASNIQVYNMSTSSPNLPSAGHDIQSFRGYTFTLMHLTSAPVSLEETMKTEKQIIFSDIKLFIEHSDERGGHIEPYVMRLWYDSGSNFWRPYSMSCFPSRDSNVNVNSLPIF